ncbi:MAG: DUF2273 domain-containing protein [Clostridia bacterium]|nr:DUF2273 domain-containing protein [Clostridia bacterium]
MKNFKRGTPAFGVLVGMIFVLAAGLLMWLGFWRTLLLVALFVLGYFLGAVEDKKAFLKGTVNRIVPEKEEETIDFRREVKEQQGTYDTRKEKEEQAETYDFRKEILEQQEELFPRKNGEGASNHENGEEE